MMKLTKQELGVVKYIIDRKGSYLQELELIFDLPNSVIVPLFKKLKEADCLDSRWLEINFVETATHFKMIIIKEDKIKELLNSSD